MSSPRSATPAECPVCGADVPPNARACPECGADEKTGWDEEATHIDGLDLPETDETKPSRVWSERGGEPQAVPTFWRWVGFAMVGVLILLLIRAIF